MKQHQNVQFWAIQLSVHPFVCQQLTVASIARKPSVFIDKAGSIMCSRLFEEAANNLNMEALMGFLSSLCEASKHQLVKMSRKLIETEEHLVEHPLMPVNSLHLYRLQNVLMKVANSERPLIHIIKAWSMVSSYLVEVGTIQITRSFQIVFMPLLFEILESSDCQSLGKSFVSQTTSIVFKYK
mgnify:FL=1